MLADSETDKSKWIGALSELHRILRKNQLKDKSVFKVMEAYDSNLPLIKTAMSAAIVDKDRIAIGNEDGLYVMELRNDGRQFFRILYVMCTYCVTSISGRLLEIAHDPYGKGLSKTESNKYAGKSAWMPGIFQSCHVLQTRCGFTYVVSSVCSCATGKAAGIKAWPNHCMDQHLLLRLQSR